MNIKGFDKDLCCRGMQFEIGKTYETGAKDDEIAICTDTVFHYCKSLQDVHCFYSCREQSGNRFCEIEVLGAEVGSSYGKFGSNRIKIIRELKKDELDVLQGLINGNTGMFNSGRWNTGNRNSGHRNSGNRNSGHRNSGDWNSGHYNSGDWNSGDWNSGDWNSGHWNTGNRNSGHRNSGNRNSGHYNSGHWNTGNYNSGHYNSGDWNKCNFTGGVFCNADDNDIRIFNKKSGMSLQDFRNSEYSEALGSVPLVLTEWTKNEAGEEYLKTHEYKNACKIWWDKLTDKNKSIIKQIPNFDADIFFDITGIKIDG
jgi:hypothetical protein